MHFSSLVLALPTRGHPLKLYYSDSRINARARSFIPSSYFYIMESFTSCYSIVTCQVVYRVIKSQLKILILIMLCLVNISLCCMCFYYLIILGILICVWMFVCLCFIRLYNFYCWPVVCDNPDRGYDPIAHFTFFIVLAYYFMWIVK